MEGEKKRFNSVVIARIALFPAFLGFVGLFVVNFVLAAAALVFISAGLLCVPLGIFYVFKAIEIISDLSPSALMTAGVFFLFFGCFLGLCFMALAPVSMRLCDKYTAFIFENKRRKIYGNFRIEKLLALFLSLSVLTFITTCGVQALSLKNGFQSTVKKEKSFFDNAKYIYVSTSGLDFEIRQYDGDRIMLEYVGDCEIITEESNENYLRLVQNDSFSVSLFAKEQFEYKMTLWLPQNNYQEFYLDSGSADITLFGTAAKYTELHTRSGNIKIYEAVGAINAAAIKGDIFCEYSAFINSGSYESLSGDINIGMPDFSGVKLKFRTESGALRGELMGLKEDFTGSLDIEKPAPLSYDLQVTTGSGNLNLNINNR